MRGQTSRVCLFLQRRQSFSVAHNDYAKLRRLIEHLGQRIKHQVHLGAIRDVPDIQRQRRIRHAQPLAQPALGRRRHVALHPVKPVRAIGQIKDARRWHTQAPHLGLQRAAGDGHRISTPRQPALLPGKEPAPQPRIRIDVSPTPAPFPVVAIQDQRQTRPQQPQGQPGQPRISQRLENVHQVWFQTRRTARHRQRDAQPRSQRIPPRGERHVDQAHAILRPLPTGVGGVIIGRHQYRDTVSPFDQRPAHKKGARAHRSLGRPGKGADHHYPHRAMPRASATPAA